MSQTQMNLKFAALIVAAGAFAAIGCSKNQGLSAEQQQKIDSAEEKIKVQNAREAELSKRIEEAAKKEVALQQQEDKIKTTLQQIAEREAKVATTQEEQNQKTKELNELNAKLAEQQNAQVQQARDLETSRANVEKLKNESESARQKLEATRSQFQKDLEKAEAMSNDNKAMYTAWSAGSGYPVVVLMNNTQATVHNEVLRSLQAVDNQTRNGFYENSNEATSRYIFSPKSKKDIEDLRKFAAAKGVKSVTVFPLNRAVVKTTAELLYTQTTAFSQTAPRSIVLGFSPYFDVGDQYSSMDFSNAATLAKLPKSCDPIDVTCFSDLREQGYMTEQAASELAQALQKSLDIRENSRPEPTIHNIRLKNEIILKVADANSDKFIHIVLPLGSKPIMLAGKHTVGNLKRDAFYSFVVDSLKTDKK